MDIINNNIDGGKAFDWGKASSDYAKYRDIYPEEFYKALVDRGLCISGQKVLDVGTGTGVLPRNMDSYGATWTGTDISAEQIEQAKLMSERAGINAEYCVSSAEELPFEAGSFDVITACQCFWYFDHARTAPLFSRLLKQDGTLVLMLMNWLPFEDELAGKTEELVLKYYPDWTGKGDTFHTIEVPEDYLGYFDLAENFAFRLPVRFTRDSWNGRIKAWSFVSDGGAEACMGEGEQSDAQIISRGIRYPPLCGLCHFEKEIR